MSKINKRNAFIAVVSCLIMLFIFCGCSFALLEREYYDDIHVQLETRHAEIIIKEWSWGLGSGAEIYYKADGKEIKLGSLSGGDDGYCPFKEGFYQITEDGNTVTFKWCFTPSDTNQTDNWKSKTFELPSNDKK